LTLAIIGARARKQREFLLGLTAKGAAGVLTLFASVRELAGAVAGKGSGEEVARFGGLGVEQPIRCHARNKSAPSMRGFPPPLIS
jgi:hypothetical protein